jgi:tyrosyl-tRNA synthetase
MGKTAEGAIWLDASLLSPYKLYQFWMNTDDADVERFLRIYTFLPLEQIQELGQLKDAAIRKAKEVLAFEVTRLTHGQEEAERAQEASRSLFAGAGERLKAADGMPTTAISSSELQEGIPVTDLFQRVGLVRSRSEARRLIEQGGAYVNGERVSAVDQIIALDAVHDGMVLLRAGKKRHHRITVNG